MAKSCEDNSSDSGDVVPGYMCVQCDSWDNFPHSQHRGKARIPSPLLLGCGYLVHLLWAGSSQVLLGAG